MTFYDEGGTEGEIKGKERGFRAGRGGDSKNESGEDRTRRLRKSRGRRIWTADLYVLLMAGAAVAGGGESFPKGGGG